MRPTLLRSCRQLTASGGGESFFPEGVALLGSHILQDVVGYQKKKKKKGIELGRCVGGYGAGVGGRKWRLDIFNYISLYIYMKFSRIRKII